MDVPATLAAIKASIDAGRMLRESVKMWEEADLKLKIADLINTLTDARIAISDLSDELRDAKRELAAERERAAEIAAMQFEAPFYWRQESDKRDGPFCQKCYDADRKAIRLIARADKLWRCAVCSVLYAGPGSRPRARSHVHAPCPRAPVVGAASPADVERGDLLRAFDRRRLDAGLRGFGGAGLVLLLRCDRFNSGSN